MQNIFAVIKYTRNLWPYMVGLAIGSVVVTVLGFGTPFVVKFATDSIVGMVTQQSAFDMSFIVLLAVIMLVINLASNILNDITGYYGDVMAMRLREQLSNRYFRHLLKLPQTYYDDELAGTIVNRLNRAIANITQFVNAFANNLLQMMLTILITVGIMFYYSWILGVLIVIIFPIYIYLTGLTSRKWQRYEKDKNKHYDIASGRFNEVISEMRLVKSFGSEHREYSSFAGHFFKMVGITRKQSRYWHIMDTYRNVALSLVFFGVYLTLFYETARGAITIGDFVLLGMLVQQVQRPLGGMSFFVDMFQRAAANSKDYVEAMQVEPERHHGRTKEVNIKDAKIEFQQVDFSYQHKEKVLHDITFTIKSGQKMALVGESGGGKSTIVNLLLQLYEPDAGDIVVNGTNTSSIALPSLRSQIATVFQDAGLFSGTIRENIAYGRPEASDDEIIAAAKAANAYDFIMKHEKGLNTEIGERGIKLSGGQKQRLAIARAVLKDAPILVLDEATSSLDTKSEHLVQQALDRLMKGRTVLIIAHRLSTIADVDQIVTLDGGKIGEIGSPRELAQSGGIYAQLLALQSQSTEKSRQTLKHFDMSA